VKNDRSLRGWVFGPWCAGGGVAVGALLTYLTNWQIGAVAGVVMGVVLAYTSSSPGAKFPEPDDEDFADELRTGLTYSKHPGNVLNSD
jgi:hypothetical protein